jgi:hypothetical protein
MAPEKCEAALARSARTWRIRGVAFAPRIWLLVAPAVLGGCGGVQAGGQTGEETDGRCSFTTTPLSPSETSPLGFSAEQALALAEGERTATFGWLETSGVAYGPESGTGRITLRTANAGPAKLAQVNTTKSVGHCEDHVRIPVTVALATAGGAFDESFTTHLVATSADRAAVTESVPSAELGGAFAFSKDTLGSRRFLRLEINLRFGADSSAGYLLGGIEGGDAASGSTSFQAVPLACWGDIPSLSLDCAR